MTRADVALFTAIHYGFTIPPECLPARAAQEDYNACGPAATEEECRIALNACLAKGWLQVIHEHSHAKIAALLQKENVLGPIMGGIPEIGCVDFTELGADLNRRLDKHFSDLNRRVYKQLPLNETPFAYTDVVHIKTAQFYRNRATAIAAIEQIHRDYQPDSLVVTGPYSVGPWRAQWWRRFPEGYRIDIDERWRWQGKGSSGGERCYLCRSPEKADPTRLRHILDCNQVTIAEWVLLAAMEDGPIKLERMKLPSWRAERGNDEFGANLSVEGQQGALEACLRHGWLRILDQQALDEIRALLNKHPAILAVPRTAEIRPEGCSYASFSLDEPVPMPDSSRWGEIDFSPNGAALYRMISDEWLGNDWEDDLNVSNEFYHEAHYYCESQEGFRNIEAKLVAEGRFIRACKVVPIGPWCVHWWEQFPSGYRKEIEIGEP